MKKIIIISSILMFMVTIDVIAKSMAVAKEQAKTLQDNNSQVEDIDKKN